MHVYGIRRKPGRSVPGVKRVAAVKELPDLLPEADFVVLTLPLTDETEGLIGKEELRSMKPAAFVVNVGRGGTIQERYLVQALQEGWIAERAFAIFIDKLKRYRDGQPLLNVVDKELGY